MKGYNNMSKYVCDFEALKTIATNIEKKIKQELEKMLAEKREDYEKFFKSFGLQLKFGIYSSYGMNKELLQDLLLYYLIFLKRFL